MSMIIDEENLTIDNAFTFILKEDFDEFISRRSQDEEVEGNFF